MAAIVVRQRLAAQLAAIDARARMVIRSEDGSLVLEAPYAPRGVDYAGVESSWVEIPRPGNVPILGAGGEPLETMTFDLFLGRRNHGSVEPQLSRIREVAESEARLVVSYGPSETGFWRLTSCSIRAEDRTENDEISRAVATLTFTEASDYDVALSPLGGGSVTGGAKKVPATYKVKKGDTLHKIAVKFYGDPKWWRKIAAFQKPPIKHPRKDRKLKPGAVLKLPRPPAKKPKGKKGKRGGKGGGK